MGKLPPYFNYFLHSCSFNKTIDFKVITDDQYEPSKLPSNVKLHYYALEEVKVLASEKLNFEVCINNSYKLCDFKPAYGLIFNDLIREYDFWGHSDLDVIFGDIRKFITNDILDNFDVIAVRDDFLTGYFQLFKNSPLVNDIFKYSKDYIKVFTTPKHFCFDETNFTFKEFENGTHYSMVSSEIESMTHVVKRLAEKKIINAYFDFHVIEGVYGNLIWENGHLFFKRKYEVLLYHMILFKNRFIFPNKRYPLKNSFKISQNRIY